MIWLVGTTLYLMVGVVLACISTAEIYNKRPRLTRQCILNTLRWMDCRAWLIAVGFVVMWLPVLTLAVNLKDDG